MFRNALRPVAHAIRAVVGTRGLSDRLAALEAAAQRASEVAALRAAPAPIVAPEPEPPPPAAPLLDVNLLLHQSRGAMLRGMPPGAKRLLSAGCAGLWYFDWIEQTYGRVAEHLGIEYYSPKPEGLPPNVTWIANTASDMSAVDSASCDLVFSGQNLEHLWPDEVAGFALEAARVLAPGGHLVIDSPNRTITAPLNWSHPQHTIELTLQEAEELVRLAGFEVTRSCGIWLCRDARTGAILPFDPNDASPPWSVTERTLVAHDRPGDSFIWWVEAKRTGRAAGAAAVHGFMADLFSRHWPERVQRLLVGPGHATRRSAEGVWVESGPGEGGPALYGPYMPLRAGRYTVTWEVRPAPGATGAVAVCDILAEGHGEPLALHRVMPGDTRVSLSFALRETTFGLQFRCCGTGGAGFSVLRRIVLDEQPA